MLGIGVGPVAVGVGAKNLLLLGEPRQLPQVSQGRHPEPVDGSALGWVSDGHDGAEIGGQFPLLAAERRRRYTPERDRRRRHELSTRTRGRAT